MNSSPAEFSKKEKIPQWIFLSLALLTVSLAIFLPIYSDEIIWKIFMARYWLDDKVAIYLHPTCVSQFSQKFPFLFLGARFLDSVLYSDLSSLLKIRVIGIFNFLIILFLFLKLLCLLKPDQYEKIQVVFFGIGAFFFLGKIPFLMAINRPEQIMVIFLLVFLILAHYPASEGSRESIKAVIFCLSCLFFFPQHAKSLMFLPFVASVLASLRLNRILKIGILCFVLFLSFTTYRFFSAQTNCTGDIGIQKIFNSILLTPRTAFAQPEYFFHQLPRNIFYSFKYFSQAGFSVPDKIGVLPDSKSLGKVGLLIDSGIYAIFTCLIIFCLFCFFRMCCGKAQHTFRTKKTFLASTLFLGLFSLALLQSWKNPYEIPLFSSGIFFCFSLCFFSRMDWPCVVGKSFFFSVLIFSTLSMGTLLYGYSWLTEQFWNSAQMSDKNRGLTVSAFNRETISQNVEQLKDLCDLRGSVEMKHLIIDDSTYSFFWNTKEPYHALYLTGFWSPSGNYLRDAVTDAKSPGFIGNCHWLSADLRAKAVSRGTICCLPRSFRFDGTPNSQK